MSWLTSKNDLKDKPLSLHHRQNNCREIVNRKLQWYWQFWLSLVIAEVTVDWKEPNRSLMTGKLCETRPDRIAALWSFVIWPDLGGAVRGVWVADGSSLSSSLPSLDCRKWFHSQWCAGWSDNLRKYFSTFSHSAIYLSDGRSKQTFTYWGAFVKFLSDGLMTLFRNLHRDFIWL